MSIRPWFLATVSLGFVAILLLMRGKSPFPTIAHILANPTNPTTPKRKRPAGRKIRAQDRLTKPIPASDLLVEEITNQTKVQQIPTKANRMRRTPRVKPLV